LIQKWSREIEIWECKECGQTFLNRRNRVEHRHS
jgi:ribosomal protein L37AE/L43A